MTVRTMNGTLPSCCVSDYQYVWILQEFPLHTLYGYFSIVLCAAGVVTNLINIVVFSTKTMICPLNNIFLALAVCDSIVSFLYIPYLYKVYLESESGFPVTKCLCLPWMVYIYFFFFVYVWIHYTSIWLTVLASIWRYIAIAYPLKCQVWCSARRTHVATVATFVICLIHGITVPQIVGVETLHMSVDENGYLSDLPTSKNTTFYTYVVAKSMSESLLLNVQYVASSLLYRFLPSAILSAISIKLVISGKQRYFVGDVATLMRCFVLQILVRVTQSSEATA